MFLESKIQLYGVTKKVKVFSIGAGGYGNDQELLALTDFYKKGFRADLIVNWQTLENDIWNNVFPTHWAWNGTPKPTFWLNNSNKLNGPSEYEGQELLNQECLIVNLIDKFLILHRDDVWSFFLPQSYTALAPNKYLTSRMQVSNEWMNALSANRLFMSEENPSTEKSHFSLGLTPRSKRMDYGIALTRALLSAAQYLATQNNSTYMLFDVGCTSQLLCRSGDFLWSNMIYSFDINQRNKNKRDLQRGFIKFSTQIDPNKQTLSIDNPHLNPDGIRLVMDQLSSYILEAKLLNSH